MPLAGTEYHSTLFVKTTIHIISVHVSEKTSESIHTISS